MDKVLHDRDIREPLFDYLEASYGKVRILEEKVTGRSRADVVMILPDAICGIEIKSDADTYARLSGQVRDYERYYDRNYVVVGTRHALHIEDHVPDSWGIITVEWDENHPDFYELRKPGPNGALRWDGKLSLMWRPELAAIQEHYQMPRYKAKSKAFVISQILDRVDVTKADEASELTALMCDLLFERDYTRADEDLAEYRRGEIARALDQETDPEKRLELMMKQEAARQNLRGGRRKRRRGRRL